MVVHDPDVTFTGGITTSHAVNRDVWYKHLRNMFHLVQSDIKQMHSQQNRLQNNPTICLHFVEMGATLCSIVTSNIA